MKKKKMKTRLFYPLVDYIEPLALLGYFGGIWMEKNSLNKIKSIKEIIYDVINV